MSFHGQHFGYRSLSSAYFCAKIIWFSDIKWKSWTGSSTHGETLAPDKILPLDAVILSRLLAEDLQTLGVYLLQCTDKEKSTKYF